MVSLPTEHKYKVLQAVDDELSPYGTIGASPSCLKSFQTSSEPLSTTLYSGSTYDRRMLLSLTKNPSFCGMARSSIISHFRLNFPWQVQAFDITSSEIFLQFFPFQRPETVFHAVTLHRSFNFLQRYIMMCHSRA